MICSLEKSGTWWTSMSCQGLLACDGAFDERSMKLTAHERPDKSIPPLCPDSKR
ncbi:hypothetical protein BDV12DRAFT_175271 [Aspergillus spectabilis]